MILRRFYDDKLAQASYLVGCAATGEASWSTPPATSSRTWRRARRGPARDARDGDAHPRRLRERRARARGARRGATVLSAEGGDGLAVRLRGRRRRAAAARRRRVHGGQRRAATAAHAGAHPGAPRLRGHRHAGAAGRWACSPATSSSWATWAGRTCWSAPRGAKDDGGERPHAVPLHPALRRAPRPPCSSGPATAWARRAEGARRGAVEHPGLRAAANWALARRGRGRLRAGGARGPAGAAGVLRAR